MSTTTGPIPDSSAGTERDTVGQNVPEQAVTEQDATEQDATEHDATEHDAAERNATANEPDPRATHANAQKSPSRDRKIKQEPLGESNMSTSRLVDNLNMAWDVSVNDTHVESSLQNLSKEAFGHIMRNSQARYCVKYGSADARSARFESALPDGSTYNETRDVTQRSNRIIERIVQIHRDNKTALPAHILSQVRILLVYWDSKVGVGHDAEVDVLHPDYPARRPHTRCFIYLKPELYAKYDLVNNTGYSHETRSIIKLCLEGNNDRQKSTTLYNLAVRLENKFEDECMGGAPCRPEPLREFVHGKKVVPGRSRSRYSTIKRSTSATPLRSPTPLPQPTPLPETQRNETPAGAKSGMSLKQRFHTEFLELFDLAPDATYVDLTEQQQLLYPAQYTKWKAVNS